MTDINAETILGALGLQRQGSSDVVAPMVGAFIVGGLIGAGLALLFSPKSGEELRRDLGQRVDEALEGKEDVVWVYNPNEDGPKKSGLSSTVGGIPSARPSGF